MAQQDFLGRLRRWFSGPSDTYFFGLQIAIKSFGEDGARPLRPRAGGRARG